MCEIGPLVHGLRQKLLVHAAEFPESQKLSQRQQPGQNTGGKDHSGSLPWQKDPEGGQRVGSGKQQSADDPGKLAELVFVVCDSSALIVGQRDPNHHQLTARHKERKQQADPQRKPGGKAKGQGSGQHSHKHLEKRVSVIGEGIIARIHPKKNDGIVFVARWVEQIGIDERAENGKRNENVQEKRFVGQRFPNRAGQHDHQRKIEELPGKNGENLPDSGQDVRKDFKSLHTVQRIGQQFANQRDLLDGVQNGVDAIGVFEGEGLQKSVKHGFPPAEQTEFSP